MQKVHTNKYKYTHTRTLRHAYKHTDIRAQVQRIHRALLVHCEIQKKKKNKKLIFLPINEKSIKKKQHTATLALSTIKFCVRKISLIKKKKKPLLKRINAVSTKSIKMNVKKL